MTTGTEKRRTVQADLQVMITGAHRGFGRALTHAYLGAGARVFPLVRKRGHAQGFDVPRCVPLIGDVRDDAVMETISGAVGANGGRLDLLVNNAGASGRGMRLDVLDSKALFSQFDLHCTGVVRCARAALPFLQASPRGVVANLSSRLGSLTNNAAGKFSGGEYSYDYRIAKAAQNMLTVCMGLELSARGIAVCAIHPGELRTDSGSADASVDPDTAAARFVEFFNDLNKDLNGRFFDLFGGELPW